MVEAQNSLPMSNDPGELQRRLVELQQQLAEAKAKNRAMWALLAEVCRKLQVSSASIKAAVSSLLDYDIFWDGSAQHEFLETIDDSVDQGANLITLLTLAFRSEADSLEMQREFHILPEILSTVIDTLSAKLPQLPLDVAWPAEGKPVFVDYGYLTVAIRLLLEVLLETRIGPDGLDLRATETETHWQIDLDHIAPAGLEAINHLAGCQASDLTLTDSLSPENVLKLFTVCRIFRLQDIQLKVLEQPPEKARLRLIFPLSGEA